MYEPEVAGSTKNNNQGSPHNKSQDQDQDQRHNSTCFPVSTMVEIQTSELRGTRSVDTVDQRHTNVLDIESKPVSAMPQSSQFNNVTLSTGTFPEPLLKTGFNGTPRCTTATNHVRSQGQHASNTTVLSVGRRLPVISNGMALHSRPRFQQSRSRTPDMPENTSMSGGSDEDLLRQGTTFANPRRPSFQADHCDDSRAQSKQALSSSNTDEVHPKSHTTGQRRPARPIPSKAREVEMRSSDLSPRHCKCSFLPDYFRVPASPIPSLTTWPAGRSEFLAHCQQIVECPAHPDITRHTCRDILDSQRRRDDVSFL